MFKSKRFDVEIKNNLHPPNLKKYSGLRRKLLVAKGFVYVACVFCTGSATYSAYLLATDAFSYLPVIGFVVGFLTGLFADHYSEEKLQDIYQLVRKNYLEIRKAAKILD